MILSLFNVIKFDSVGVRPFNFMHATIHKSACSVNGRTKAGTGKTFSATFQVSSYVHFHMQLIKSKRYCWPLVSILIISYCWWKMSMEGMKRWGTLLTFDYPWSTARPRLFARRISTIIFKCTYLRKKGETGQFERTQITIPCKQSPFEGKKLSLCHLSKVYKSPRPLDSPVARGKLWNFFRNLRYYAVLRPW